MLQGTLDPRTPYTGAVFYSVDGASLF